MMRRFLFLVLFLPCVMPPERAGAETHTVVTVPDVAVPRTPEEKEAWQRDLCRKGDDLPSGTARPDPDVCARFAQEDAFQADLARERSVPQGHPVDAVTPVDPVKPVN